MGHPSEMELQQYALDHSTCNRETVQHIQACENCQAQAAAYRSLFAGIKELPRPVFDFDISGLILSQLPDRLTEKAALIPNYIARPVSVGQTRAQTKVSGFSPMAWVLASLSTAVFGITIYLFRKNIWNMFGGISVFFIYSILVAASIIVLIRVMGMYRKFLLQMEALNF
jgi:hypothetical protein